MKHAADRPLQLDARNVLEHSLRLRARLERLRASLMGHCLNLVYDDASDPTILAHIHKLLDKRRALLAELQQLQFESEHESEHIAPPNPIQHLRDALGSSGAGPTAAPAAPGPAARASGGAPPPPLIPLPSGDQTPPVGAVAGLAASAASAVSPPADAADAADVPVRRTIQIRSRPASTETPALTPQNLQNPTGNPATPLTPSTPSTPAAPSPPLFSAPAVVNDAIKRKLQDALTAIKDKDDLVDRRVNARQLLIDLHSEVHDIDEASLDDPDGQHKEIGNLEYLCYVGLFPISLIPDLRAPWLKMVQARLRALQHHPLPKPIDDRATKISEQLKEFVKEHALSPIHGSLVKDRPLQGTWAGDARFNLVQLQKKLEAEAAPVPPPVNTDNLLHHLRQNLDANNVPEIQRIIDLLLTRSSASNPKLLNLLRPNLERIQSLLKGDGRRAIEHALKQQDRAAAPAAPATPDAASNDDTTLVPEDWSWWPLTRGKRAVIIGGEVRPEQRQRLETAFGFSQLKWHTTNVRRDEALAEQIRRKRVDFVIFTRFAQHRETYIIRPACQSVGIPCVRLSHGYGVLELQKVIEVSLAAPSALPPDPSTNP